VRSESLRRASDQPKSTIWVLSSLVSLLQDNHAHPHAHFYTLNYTHTRIRSEGDVANVANVAYENTSVSTGTINVFAESSA